MFADATVLIRTSKRHDRAPGVSNYWFGVQDQVFSHYPRAFLVLVCEDRSPLVIPMSELSPHRSSLSKGKDGSRKLNVVIEGGNPFLAVGGRRIRLADFQDAFHLLGKRPSPELSSREAKDSQILNTQTTASAKTDSVGEDERTQLTLERDLEEHLAHNLTSVETGLKLYQEHEVSGRQLRTDVGIIDILATDQNGELVVMELKAGTAPDRALTQLLAYMDWVESNIAKGRPVRGLLVAANFDPRLEMAARRVPTVRLLRYRVRFEVEQV